MLAQFANSWWLLLLRGVCAILFGLMAFAWPGLSLLTLVVLYGAYALADGALPIGAAIAGRGGATPTWWLLLIGVLGIAVGVLTFLWPGITAYVLVVTIAVWTIVRGAFEIAGGIALRKEINNEWLLILGGLVSVAFGVLVLRAPDAGALALVWLIGGWAIAFGVVLVGLAFRVRGLRRYVDGLADAVAGRARPDDAGTEARPF
jgi:uncharacterized membrane protein HdeD (DUF308 family)